MFAKFKKINFLFIFIVILIFIIGFSALYSASGGNVDPWARPHAIRFIISLFILIFISVTDIRIIYRYAYLFFLVCFALLGLVEIAGSFGFGAKRWIRIFGISLQPSELIKVSIIIVLSRYYHDLRFHRIGKIRNSIIPALIIMIPFVFILIQPDLGTAVMVFLLGVGIMYAAGVKIWKFAFGFILGLVSIPVFWNYLQPYQKKRFLSFLNPESDTLGQGYQLLQSKIALGSGGLTGKGFLQGSQSYLEYLPEKQTDFIFTLIGEEFGFIGTSFIILLFIFIILIAYYISLKSNTVFAKILSIGVAINFFLYIILNMSMVVGLMPVVGIPLPLISYGGTAMLSVMISFGLLINMEIHNNITKFN